MFAGSAYNFAGNGQTHESNRCIDIYYSPSAIEKKDSLFGYPPCRFIRARTECKCKYLHRVDNCRCAEPYILGYRKIFVRVDLKENEFNNLKNNVF